MAGDGAGVGQGCDLVDDHAPPPRVVRGVVPVLHEDRVEGVGAAVAGLAGKNKVAEATPAAPERAIQGIKEDIATVKGAHHD